MKRFDGDKVKLTGVDWKNECNQASIVRSFLGVCNKHRIAEVGHLLYTIYQLIKGGALPKSPVTHTIL